MVPIITLVIQNKIYFLKFFAESYLRLNLDIKNV